MTTATRSFGAGDREGHDSSEFYARFPTPEISDDDTINALGIRRGGWCIKGDARNMDLVPDKSVALVVTSPPYFVGKEYELEVEGRKVPESYIEFLGMLRDVFAECERVLEPGGRIAVNVANLGRKPYRSLSADVIGILQDELGFLMRGEVIWRKAEGASGNVAWGSFRSPNNPVLRDLTERVIIASKGRFDRALTPALRREHNLPHESTLTADGFMESTLDMWNIRAESAKRIGHPAPFPVELPERLIDLYTFEGDVVLDPFMGAGSTLVAAKRTGRIGVGYDLEAKYVKLSKGRVAETKRRETLPAHLEPEKGTRKYVRTLLEEAGFRTDERWKLPGVGAVFDFVATGKGRGNRFLVDLLGTVGHEPPTVDDFYLAAGRASALAASTKTQARYLLVTSERLPARHEGLKLVRALGPEVVFDVLDLTNADHVAHLQTFALPPQSQPKPVFWET